MRRRFIGVAFLTLVLSACGGKGGIYPTTKTYTVRWENWDGALLETDSNVKEGSWPTYNGSTPHRIDDEHYTYSWSGWYPNLAPVRSNITYTATYFSDEKIIDYTITFDTRGGSKINPVTIRKGELLDRPQDPVKSNYSFGGWYTDNTLTNEYDFSRPVNSSFTLYAKWNTTEYIVTYNLNYDNLPTVSYSTKDGYITYRPTRSGYVFNGWWLSDGFIDGQPILSRSFSFDTRVTSNNLVLYAEWVEEKMVSNELDAPVVTIDGDNISWSEVKNATKYQVIIEKSGIQYVNEQRNYTYIYFPSTLDAGKYTIKVRAIGDSVNYYNSQYTSKTYAHRMLTSVTGIKFDESKGVLSWDEVKNADSYELIVDSVSILNTSSTQYNLGSLYAGNHTVKVTASKYGWVSSSGNIKFVIHRLTAPTNLSATLDEGTLDYEVTWDEVRMDSGYANSYVVYLNGTKIETVSTNKCTIKHNPSHYVDYQVSISVAAYDQNSDYLISPISEELVLEQYFKITYELNGGINNQSNPNSYKKDDIITLQDPTKTGSIFLGWYDNNNVKKEKIALGDGDIILIAKWEAINYVITLDCDGGEPSEYSIEAQYNCEYLLPEPTMNGYSFTGWYDGSTKVSSNGTWKYTCNKTFIAHWTIINYSISYTLNGGTNNSSNPSSYTVEDAITFAAPSKTGYTFLGWYDGDNKVTGIPLGSTGIVSVEARWSADLHTLSVTSEDTTKGTVAVTSGSGYSDESITVVATPVGDCVFKGWYHESTKVTDAATYTFIMPTNDYSLVAHFFTKAEEEELWNIAHGVIPTLSNDGKTITYGLYPQTNINDSSLISALNSLITPESNGWYLYEGEYYAKVSASPYRISYKFDNGTNIISGKTYWFKCEPIVWNVLSNTSGEYYIVSSVLLDAHCYYNSTSSRTIDGQTIYANNYKYSDIRTWLNNDFYNSAFALGNSNIQLTNVDNSASTTNMTSNSYTCANTQDKVFLPSYKDYINSSYGFSTSTSSSTDTRYCKTTDWARARGAYYYTNSDSYLYNGDYWTRSPASSRSHIAWSVLGDGSLGYDYLGVSITCNSVRPGLTIKIA